MVKSETGKKKKEELEELGIDHGLHKRKDCWTSRLKLVLGVQKQNHLKELTMVIIIPGSGAVGLDGWDSAQKLKG